MPDQQMTPEQQQELQEKIKNMSPEELREFQKQNCIFCHIISGKVQSKKIYEDDKVLAVLDINPANPGHIVLLTKEHYSIMPQIPDETIKYLGIIAKQLSRTIIQALKVDGTTIFIANGIAAGQKAQHFMIHIIPRKENDNIGLEIRPGNVSIDDQMQIKDNLRSKLLSSLGIEEGDVEIEAPEKAIKVEGESEEGQEEAESEREEDAEEEWEEGEGDKESKEGEDPGDQGESQEDESLESGEEEKPKEEIDVDELKAQLGDEEEKSEEEVTKDEDEEEPEDEGEAQEERDEEEERRAEEDGNDEGEEQEVGEEKEAEEKPKKGLNLDDISALFK